MQKPWKGIGQEVRIHPEEVFLAEIEMLKTGSNFISQLKEKPGGNLGVRDDKSGQVELCQDCPPQRSPVL